MPVPHQLRCRTAYVRSIASSGKIIWWISTSSMDSKPSLRIVLSTSLTRFMWKAKFLCESARDWKLPPRKGVDRMCDCLRLCDVENCEALELEQGLLQRNRTRVDGVCLEFQREIWRQLRRIRQLEAIQAAHGISISEEDWYRFCWTLWLIELLKYWSAASIWQGALLMADRCTTVARPDGKADHKLRWGGSKTPENKWGYTSSRLELKQRTEEAWGSIFANREDPYCYEPVSLLKKHFAL